MLRGAESVTLAVDDTGKFCEYLRDRPRTDLLEAEE